MHKIEQELGTEIKPIPKVIDPRLYVAEYQQESGSSFDVNAESLKSASEFSKDLNKELSDEKEQNKPSLLQQHHMPHMIAQQ